MKRESQISAFVSRTTRTLLEAHVRSTGVKKGHVVEAALRHHLSALQELPTDIVVQPRIVVSRRSGAAIESRMRRSKPTAALRKLMTRDGG